MKKILYIDLGNTLVDFPSAFSDLSADTIAEYEGRMDEVPGIFARTARMPGALDTYCTPAEGTPAWRG